MDPLKKQLLILILKMILLIMAFQILTLVGGLVIGNLANEIYPSLEFQNSQAFSASSAATVTMIVSVFVMAWFVYKNKIKKILAAVICTIPVFVIWTFVLLFN